MKESDALRADAKANRERILNVARSAFAADPTASLNSIAKAAGVGAGTLYRHFPSREALLLGIYRQEIDALVELAASLLASHPSLVAFRLWCKRFVQFGAVKHGIADTFSTAVPEQGIEALRSAVSCLINACEESGDIHARARPDDILTLLGLLLRLSPSDEGREQTERILDLVFSGMSTDIAKLNGYRCRDE
ncbi:TetR/AcrR family transcriptional regulator [Pantoea sp. BAV 3049]|uniref:TetR/AcrR family transcriptional regulator n=1 Tax=Pantoea sp. BAV 3049 TaxID=2654188 RepID=UPI00131C8CFC|nr:TetR/AcrR family transcriptional regulator [Pantoea sp. BAV 3049]